MRRRATLLPALLLFVAAGTPTPSSCSSRPAPPLFDCNGNGEEDAVDIAVGASEDVNFNGIPDECEPAGSCDCWGEAGSRAPRGAATPLGH